MMTTRRKTKANSNKFENAVSSDEEEEKAEFEFSVPSIDTEVPVELLPAIKNKIIYVKDATSPELSVIFIVALLGFSYFYENYSSHVYDTILVCWLVFQLVGTLLKDDENTLFYAILGLLGQILFYLLIGYSWSNAKLFIDISQGYITKDISDAITNCKGDTFCLFKILYDIKWWIVRHMITWPLSLTNTLIRDPLRIFTDAIFEHSKRRYVAIINAASSQESLGVSPLYLFIAIIVYCIIGFIWTHLKLYMEVRFGTLSPKLDREVTDLFNSKQGYWEFVKKIKWTVIEWGVIWPISISYLLLKRPLVYIFEILYQLSQRRFVRIVETAMESRMSQNKQ